MEENPSRVPRNSSSRRRPPTKGKSRHGCPEESEAGDQIDCSGKNCQSCTAGIIADCVAVCCCPCAVLSFCALAFVKAPWMMGRRCLGIGKKNRRRKEKARKCEGDGGDCSVGDMGEIPRKGRVESGKSETETEQVEGDEEEEEEEDLSARFDSEKVWLELYQLGHLDFGRVSFTGIHPEGKGN